MSTVLVQALPGLLPTGFCPSGEGALQEIYNEFILRTQFSLQADKAFYNKGATAPTPENRQFPWLQTSSGNPVSWWIFKDGFWIWPNQSPASSNERKLWVGTTVELETFDGGESAAIPITASTGPMWEVDTDFAGRSPMGVGAVPNSTPSKTLALDENYGDGTHQILPTELPDIKTMATVAIGTMPFSNSNGTSGTIDQGGSANQPGLTNDTTTYPTYSLLSSLKAQLVSTQTTTDTPINTVHPVRGCYIIKRTARIYYRQ